MKQLLLALALAACGAPPGSPAAPAPAKKFSMRSYTFVLLKRGPAWLDELTSRGCLVYL